MPPQILLWIADVVADFPLTLGVRVVELALVS